MLEYQMKGSSDNWNAEAYKKFVASAFDGTHPRAYASQPIPKDNDGPVLIIVGKEYDKLVLENPKDMAVLLYSPNCGHCKKMLPEWDKLGELYKNDGNTVIAKIDATRDYYGETNINGYPTIVFLPKNDRSAYKTYDSNNRSASDFKNWIETVRHEKPEDKKEEL